MPRLLVCLFNWNSEPYYVLSSLNRKSKTIARFNTYETNRLMVHRPNNSTARIPCNIFRGLCPTAPRLWLVLGAWVQSPVSNIGTKRGANSTRQELHSNRQMSRWVSYLNFRYIISVALRLLIHKSRIYLQFASSIERRVSVLSGKDKVVSASGLQDPRTRPDRFRCSYLRSNYIGQIPIAQ